MNQRSFFALLVAAFALLAISWTSRPGLAASYDHCIRRGEPQWHGDQLEARLQNGCGTPVRVHWCVRQDDGDLKCGISPALPASGVTVARAIDAKRPAEILIEACEVGGHCRVRNH